MYSSAKAYLDQLRTELTTVGERLRRFIGRPETMMFVNSDGTDVEFDPILKLNPIIVTSTAEANASKEYSQSLKMVYDNWMLKRL